MWEQISINAYDYRLPPTQIASHPLEERDASRLLVYDLGQIYDRCFRDLPDVLPAGALLVRNNTRVVPARLLFAKDSGAIIEIFCLEPLEPADYNLSFAQTGSVVWKAMVGNKKRWKSGHIHLYNPVNDKECAHLSLLASCVGQDGDTFYIRFCWQGGLSFSEVLAICGRIPIPPYLGREAEPEDRERYQTIYALRKGSVAAPTAGLHFSDYVISCIKDKKIEFTELTLHVGAGTFTPVKTHLLSQHQMHSEPFSVSRAFVETLYNQKGPVVAVGTTSARCIESLYYFGIMCSMGQEPDFLPQWEAYRMPPLLDRKAALEALLLYMQKNGLEVFEARTQIMIVPSFKFRFTNGLITNFHQPKSTLLLLIAAFIGEDWRKCYAHALEQNYRFLSYGDSSLLLQSREK
ncbi:MAG: S-adenosylmethionine:tRNA ribosyltransferase-isomerase [Bacteroidales bacterium]|nr:S-adenosylmethionine:tRNA ribosyltransferase-isomerase [Bacteroidales bacterium]MCL2739246.1 S-adenosylmethionine:tRNA ribosyltransferase-isomerase [Bacteroidales bacterium]